MSPLYRKIAWRLVPFLMLLYMVAFLDRVNISFAALTMNRDLGITESEYGFAAGVFFLSYCLFEVPANLVLARMGARRWLAVLMVIWGVVSMSTAFVHTEMSYIGVRFLLGIAESGFYPGVIYYFTFWLPRTLRTRILALFLLAVPLCNSIGSPISAHILMLNNLSGLRGWQWLFLLEGAPAVILGIASLVAARRRALFRALAFCRRTRSRSKPISSATSALQTEVGKQTAARCAGLRCLLPLEQRQLRSHLLAAQDPQRPWRVKRVHRLVGIRDLRLWCDRDAVGQPPPRVSGVAVSVFRFHAGIHRCRPGSVRPHGRRRVQPRRDGNPGLSADVLESRRQPPFREKLPERPSPWSTPSARSGPSPDRPPWDGCTTSPTTTLPASGPLPLPWRIGGALVYRESLKTPVAVPQSAD